ncbi:MAG: pyridoxamine 5'-phosphate oxidase family protein [Spirochaetales bacterium]|nr:pyridoxamine 5'-phosphate oxidase family protein [Spirochaetales bacterium]
MRRSDKQITDQKLIDEILLNNTICRLALLDGERPYVIPMDYGYNNQTFYLHTATEGTKLELINKNNNACIEVTDSIELLTSDKGCDFSTKYRSVICSGKVQPVLDFVQKVEGLKVILKQHTGKSDWNIPEAAVKSVVVLKLDIETITGKISGF